MLRRRMSTPVFLCAKIHLFDKKATKNHPRLGPAARSRWRSDSAAAADRDFAIAVISLTDGGAYTFAVSLPELFKQIRRILSDAEIQGFRSAQSDQAATEA